MHAFDAIVFDMDGLLVDSEPVWQTAEHAVVEGHGVAADAAFHQQITGVGILEWAQATRAHYGLAAPPEQLQRELLDGMLRLIPERVRAQPGAREVLAFVGERALPRAIASSSHLSLIQATLAAMGWGEVFPIRCSAEEVPRGKPAPDVYLLAAERLGVDPTRCLALEDSPTGARAARAAGMTCWAVPDPAHTTARAFDGITPHVFADLKELLRALA